MANVTLSNYSPLNKLRAVTASTGSILSSPPSKTASPKRSSAVTNSPVVTFRPPSEASAAISFLSAGEKPR